MIVPKDTMTPLDRVLCYLKGERPDRVACFPLILNHAARVLGVPIGKYTRDGDIMGRAHVASYRRYGNDLITFFTTTATLAEAMGTRLTYFDEDVPQITDPLIKELDDIKKVHAPDFSRDGRLPVYLNATEFAVKEIGSEVFISTVIAGPFTTAAHLRQTDLFIKDLYKNKEWLHQLLDICTGICIRFIDEILRRKSLPIIVEPIATGSLISPAHFNEFVTPYLKRVSDHIHKAGGGMPAALHICGKTRPNWQAMLGTGFDMWSLDRVDMGEAKEAVGSKVALIGNVNSTNLLKSTPAAIDEEARIVCEKTLDSPCGFILGSGCEVPIETPPENVDALINAARKYGRFEH